MNAVIMSFDSNEKQSVICERHCPTLLRCPTPLLSRPFFTPWKAHVRMNLDHVASGHFVLGRGVLCEFADYCHLAVGMPPAKLCPQCKAAVL